MKIKGISIDFFTFFVFLYENYAMKTIIWLVFTLQFRITFNWHHMKQKLARFLCLAKNYRIKVSKRFCSYLMEKLEFVPLIFAYHFSQMACIDKKWIPANREMLPGSHGFNYLFLCFISITHLFLRGRQNHCPCPKSKCYHRGNMRKPSGCRWTVTDGLKDITVERSALKLNLVLMRWKIIRTFWAE